MNDEYYLQKAIKIAVDAHDGQYDKLGMPYILHPLTVASYVETTREKIVAVLHDVLEDTYVEREDLDAAGIPSGLIYVVELLTHRKGESYEAYLARVKSHPMAVTVKLADIKHNTDPSRTRKLDLATAQRLKNKYDFALGYLRS